MKKGVTTLEYQDKKLTIENTIHLNKKLWLMTGNIRTFESPIR